jgi:HK97 family phage major capsid protein
VAISTEQTLRERLKDAREQISSARDRRKAARDERDAAKNAFAAASGTGRVQDWPEYQAAENAVATLGRIDDELADAKKAEKTILSLLGADDGAGDPGGNDLGSYAELGRIWDGRRLLKAEGSPYRREIEKGTFTSTNQFGSVVLGQISTRDNMAEFLSAALPAAPAGPVDALSGMAGARPADRRGFVQPLMRRLTLLDLIPIGTTDATTIEYVQVVAVPGNAAEVADDGTIKPQEGLTTVDASAPVRTIAGWIKLQRQAMDDVAGLATLINTLLPYDVRRRLEGQILAGDGVGQNLRGVLNTTGIGAPPFVAGDNAADAILRAMTTIILSDGDPNFAAANPLTWQDILLMREDSGGARTGMYLAGGPFSMTAPTIWGLNLVANRVVPQPTPLVGDSNALTLLVKEGVNVKVSDSDQDDFVRNRVTVLAEGRFALPIWRPASLAVADTTAA